MSSVPTPPTFGDWVIQQASRSDNNVWVIAHNPVVGLTINMSDELTDFVGESDWSFSRLPGGTFENSDNEDAFRVEAEFGSSSVSLDIPGKSDIKEMGHWIKNNIPVGGEWSA